MTESAPLPIMVVDDDQAILEIFEEMFAQTNFRIVPFNNGSDAVRAAHQDKFPIAFIDLFMPGMNGLELLIELRKIQPELMAVMISGFRNESLLEQALRAGAYTYLYKPLGRPDIMGVMLKCLRKLGLGEYSGDA